MAWLFKKKKVKAGLEIPPPPEVPPAPKPKEMAAEKIEIPDTFHEIKFPKEEGEVHEMEEFRPTDAPVEAETEELFKPVAEVAKPDIPEMPELPEIPEVSEERERLPEKAVQGPIFVKSRDYQDILGKITNIKESVQHTEDIFTRMNEIKNEKDKIFSQWKESLEDVQRKLIYMEKVLYEV